MEKNFQGEVLDFYELSAEVENVCAEWYNEDGRVNWILYVTGRYTGNYTDSSFQTNLPVPYGTTTKLELDWNDALNGQGGGWDYSCIERGFGEYHGGHAFILANNPMLAGRYSATLSFGDVTKTVYFTLVYNGNYTSGTGWSVTNVSWK